MSDEFDREEQSELLDQSLAVPEAAQPEEVLDDLQDGGPEPAGLEENDAQEWNEIEEADSDLQPQESEVPEQDEELNWSSGVELPRRPLGWNGKPQKRTLVKPDEVRQAFSPHERLLILDTWQRSGLPAGDFAPLVGISKHTLYLWKKRFSQHGPAGLAEQPRGVTSGSKLPEVTKRTIVMLKELHPDWGCQRLSDELLRGPALSASPAAVARVLHEAGYQAETRPTRPHAPKVQRFERARPNQLWQTDLFTFVLKRQNRRLYLVAFLDDHSRFLVGYGLHASDSITESDVDTRIAGYVVRDEPVTLGR